MKFQILVFAAFSFLLITSCSKDPVQGCTDATAVNFDADAEEDNGSCSFASDQLIGDWSVTETEGGQTYNYTATVTARDNENIVITGQRSSPPVYFQFVNPLEMKVEWADKELTKTGTSVSGTITDENNFTVNMSIGIGVNIFSVTQEYSR